MGKQKVNMEIFIVDGSEKNFADVIIENKKDGKICMVASYGFGVNQVNRIISAFMIGKISDIIGVEKIMELMGNPENIVIGTKGQDEKLDIDIMMKEAMNG